MVFNGTLDQSVHHTLVDCREKLQDSSLSNCCTTRLNFEELITVLAQTEACLNSRPLGVISHPNDEGIEVLTPGDWLTY